MTNSLSTEMIEALRALDSPTVSNGLVALQVRTNTEGFVSMDLRCRFPDLPPMVGYAVTCTVDSTPLGPNRPNCLQELFEAIAGAPKPAVVAIGYVGDDPRRCCCVGDILTTAFQRLGAVGCVTNCGFRDLTGIRQHSPGFQLFAPGAVVTGNALPLEVGIPVSLDGLEIRPGDLLHGDESGVLQVPLETVEGVLEKLKGIQTWETGVIEFMQKGPFTVDELMQQFKH